MLFLIGCKDSELTPDKLSLGYAYFPLDWGKYVEYEIKTKTYTLLALPTTKQYQVREMITESYTNSENKTSYKIQRYKRNNATQPWAVDSIWSTNIDNFQAFRSENNKTFLKLAFPLIEGAKWNGNAFNNLKKDDCVLTELDLAKKINNFQFDKTLTVVLANDSNFVYQDRRHEIYARNVGLVYKYTKSYNYCQTCGQQTKIETGIEKTQTILNYGKSF